MHSVRSTMLLTAALFIPALVSGQVVINEIRTDQSSTDLDEYFELSGPPSQSLAGLTYIVIGDGSTGSGTVEAVIDLSGQSIGTSGYFVAAESTFSLGQADLTADLNFENSDNVTHLLVSGWTGANGDDLDTDDDGTLDVTPWTAVEDCIALVEEPQAGDQIYCASTIGPDGTFVPGHSGRCPDGSGPFEILDFGLGTDDTPGGANACGEICDDGLDNDFDGLTDCLDDDCDLVPPCATPPANDDCASAQAIGEGTISVSTVGASTDGPVGCGGSLVNDVWLLYTATCSGPVIFTTCGTTSATTPDFNPQMAIYDATLGCPTGNDFIACDAGSCMGSGEPEILLDVVSGQSYYVQIGNFVGATRGILDLTITCPPADCHLFPNPNLTESYTAETTFSNAPVADIGFVPALDSIIVTGVGTIADVDVAVQTTHPWVGDLIIEMISPSSTQIRLHDEAGGSQFDMDVIFDDEGAAYDTVPFFGGVRMQPFEALTAFDGQNADGGWAITVLDTFLMMGDPVRGTLDEWELRFFTPLAIPDNDPAGLVTTLDVSASNLSGIDDLDIEMDLSHPATAELTVSLESPAGTTVTLHNQSPGVDLIGRFDDPAGGDNDGFGSLIVDGPGLLADFEGQFIAGTWTLTATDGAAGNSGELRGWDLLVCPSVCVGTTDLVGSSNCFDDSVTLGWVNGDTYNTHEIYRDGVLIGSAAGADQTFVDTAPLVGFHEYLVRSLCASGAGESTRFVNHAAYNGEAHIVLQLEGLVDFGDPGSTDSGAAIEAALIANGLTDVVRVSIDPDDFPCLSAPTVQSLWVACGTFPFNYRLDPSEGDALGNASAAGIALYLESTDHWGFFHDDSSLDARDGVDDLSHSTMQTNGDDTFTGMDGSNSGSGLDLSALQNILYTQEDVVMDESTDQLTLTGTEGNAGVVWTLDDSLGTPYNTGIFNVPTSGGNVLVQTWELGGFGGDLNTLVGDYIDALVPVVEICDNGVDDDADGDIDCADSDCLTDPACLSGGFLRADCNADGSLNIADAIFTLGNLFSMGPDGPCADACDANDDGSVNIADAIYSLGNLFSMGPNPPAPFGACGDDPSADGLDCAAFPPCP